MVEARPDLGAAQQTHWELTYRAHPRMYGDHPSDPAIRSAEAFGAARARDLLELGAGHGRDTLWFAQQGFRMVATDFSGTALAQLREAARVAGLTERVRAVRADVRRPLPFSDASVDGVFAHMLLCMALSTPQIRALVGEVGRVLRPGGTFVYTVRHTADAHYGAGAAHGDDIYEHGGFAVHFFSRELVDTLAEGWRLDELASFEEGELPRRLWRVTQVKSGRSPDAA